MSENKYKYIPTTKHKFNKLFSCWNIKMERIYAIISIINTKSLYTNKTFVNDTLMDNTDIVNIPCIECKSNNSINIVSKINTKNFLCEDCKDVEVNIVHQKLIITELKKISGSIAVNSNNNDFLDKIDIKDIEHDEIKQRVDRFKEIYL